MNNLVGVEDRQVKLTEIVNLKTAEEIGKIKAAIEPISPNPMPATTTVEQDLHTQAARDNDQTWESTQRQIALIVVISAVVYAFVTIWFVPKVESTTVFFASAFTLVIGFYFGRTNHARLGGVTPKLESNSDTAK